MIRDRIAERVSRIAPHADLEIAGLMMDLLDRAYAEADAGRPE